MMFVGSASAHPMSVPTLLTGCGVILLVMAALTLFSNNVRKAQSKDWGVPNLEDSERKSALKSIFFQIARGKTTNLIPYATAGLGLVLIVWGGVAHVA
jgi:hypothetical protein